MAKVKRWEIILKIKTKNGISNYKTIIEANSESYAVQSAKNEVKKEYTILEVVSVKEIK